jgi:hypothetical protein
MPSNQISTTLYSAIIQSVSDAVAIGILWLRFLAIFSPTRGIVHSSQLVSSLVNHVVCENRISLHQNKILR